MGRWDERRQVDADTGQPATTAGSKGCDPHSGDGFRHGHKFQQHQEQGGMGQPTGHWAVQGQGHGQLDHTLTSAVVPVYKDKMMLLVS